MELSLSNEVHRPLIPFSELGWNKEDIFGIPNTAPTVSSDLQKQMMKSDPMISNDKKIKLSSIYPSQEALQGDAAINSRFVFYTGSLIESAGTSQIYHAVDRLTGKKGVAKITDSHFYDEFRPQYNEMIQLEGELMFALSQDSYLSKHVIQVWDVANIKLNGKESIVIFEEEMDGDIEPKLANFQDLDKLGLNDRIDLIEQLCTTVDHMAKQGIFNHDLSSEKNYIKLYKMLYIQKIKSLVLYETKRHLLSEE